MLCCLINHNAESGLSCLFDKEYIFLFFFHYLKFLYQSPFICRGLFSSFEDKSISSLESCPAIIGL